MCSVESLTTSEIKCRTPPKSHDYNVNVAQTVLLTNRLMVDNTCGGSCSFSYLTEAQSPTLTSMSANTITSGSIILNGTNFNLGSPVVVLTNLNTSLVTLVTPSSVSSTSLTFTVPTIEAGQYNVKVRVDPSGETNAYRLVVNSAFTSNFPTSISTSGGRFTITGTGLPNGWPNKYFSLTVTHNNTVIQPSIFASSPSSFVVVIPPSASGDFFSVSLTTPSSQVLTSTTTALTDRTPILTLSTPTTASAGSLTFTFTQSNLFSALPSFV